MVERSPILSFADLGLSPSAVQTLASARCDTLPALLSLTASQVARLEPAGRTVVGEVVDALVRHGLGLAPEPDASSLPAAAAPEEPTPANDATLGAFAFKGKKKPRSPRVYDRHGNEVFIAYACNQCGVSHALADYGLRQMANGTIRNIATCKPCRAKYPKRKKTEASHG